MKCVANVRCQAINGAGQIQFYKKGEVDEFEECPPSFSPIEGADVAPIDFDTAGEAELLESEYNIDDLKQYILEKYNKKAGSRGKEKTVALMLDCRFRDLGDQDLNQVL